MGYFGFFDRKIQNNPLCIGFDLWQVQAGTVFDNILITDDLDSALEHAKKFVKRVWPLEKKNILDFEMEEHENGIAENEAAKQELQGRDHNQKKKL